MNMPLHPTIIEADLTNTDNAEPMTEKQAIEMGELAKAAGEPMDTSLTKAQADERIAYLREKIHTDEPGLTR